MKQSFRLICFPGRQVLLRQGVPIVFLYGCLLPYQMRLLGLGDPMMTAQEIFRSSQLFLAFTALWPLFCFFLPVFQPGVWEALQALRHPVNSCVLQLAAIQQVICIPLYIWMLFALPNDPGIVPILIFQAVCLSAAFSFLLYLLHSPIINMAAGLLFICSMIPLADTNVPLLLRPGRLPDGFGTDYWMVHICILITEIVCMTALWRFRRYNNC